MPEKFSFACPHCNQKWSLGMDKIQTKVKCTCNHTFYAMAGNNLQLPNGHPDNKPQPSTPPLQHNNLPGVENSHPKSSRPIRRRPARKASAYRDYRPFTPDSDDSHSFDQSYSRRSRDFPGILITTALLILSCVYFLFTYFPHTTEQDKQGSTVFLLIVTLSLILPLINAYLADEKTGHAWLWFILSIVLTPIFALVALLILLAKDRNQYRP